MNRRSFFQNLGLLCGAAMLKVAPIAVPETDFFTEVKPIGDAPKIQWVKSVTWYEYPSMTVHIIKITHGDEVIYCRDTTRGRIGIGES